MNIYNKKAKSNLSDSSDKEMNVLNPLDKRKIGIKIIGDVPWGTHLCQFYQTKDDLIDILVPYFKTGLESNEFCMWITAEPLLVEDAKKALKKAVKNIDDYIKKGQIEILDASQWYLRSGKFDADEVLAGWVQKEKDARKKGFDGLRLTGNTFWLEKKDWKDFTKYEEVINSVIGNYRMIAICSYSLDKCNASEIIDVVSNHQFALIKREGSWHRIESPEMKKAVDAKKEAEEKVGELIKYAPTGIFEIDFRVQRFSSINDVVCQYLGYSREELLAMNPMDLLEGESKNLFQERIKKQLRGEHVASSVEYVFKTRSGETRDAELNISFTYDDKKPVGAFVIAHDVTERKKIQESLRENELKYHTVADFTYDFEFWINPEGNFLYVSPSSKRITGYSPEDFLSDSSLRQKLIHPDDKQKFLAHVLQERSQKKSDEIEYRIIHKDGSIRWIHHVCQPIRDEKGQFLGIRGSNRGITDRKKNEEITRINEERLKLAQVSSGAGLWDWDIPSGKLEWSEELFSLFGLDRKKDEANFDTWGRIIHPDDKFKAEQRIQTAIDTHTSLSNEYRIILPSSEVRWINALGKTTYDHDGKPLRMIGICLDITERKKAESEIQKQSQYRQLALDAANMGWWQYNPITRMAIWDDGYTRIFGVTGNERLNDEILAQIIHPDDISTLWAKVEAALNPVDPKPYKTEYRIIRPDGKMRWIEAYGIPIFEGEGVNRKAVNFVGTVADITDRKNSEEELRSMNEELMRFNKTMVGRETRMIELKKQVNKLSAKLGQPEPYYIKAAEELH